jgi:hypothetical protein
MAYLRHASTGCFPKCYSYFLPKGTKPFILPLIRMSLLDKADQVAVLSHLDAISCPSTIDERQVKDEHPSPQSLKGSRCPPC